MKLLLMFAAFAGVGLAQNPTICNLTGRQTTGQILIASNNNKTCHWGSAAGTGDVLGPPTNSANFFPQWNGANSKTLLNGVAGSGSGNVCLTTNCVMTTPNVGQPSAIDLTNATKIPLVLTTTGTSGAATYTQATNTLNIPQYTGGGISGLTNTKIPKATSSTTIADSSLSDDGTTVLTAEAFQAATICAGSGSCPALTPGTGGVFGAAPEGTAPSVGAASAVDVCYADSTAHGVLCSYNNSSYLPLGRVIARGSKALDFASTATGACATVITDTATGAASTDVILFNANASIKAVTGYVPASTGGFSIAAYPTANTVNFEACNWTAGTVDPGSITVNWVVIR